MNVTSSDQGETGSVSKDIRGADPKGLEMEGGSQKRRQDTHLWEPKQGPEPDVG